MGRFVKRLQGADRYGCLKLRIDQEVNGCHMPAATAVAQGGALPVLFSISMSAAMGGGGFCRLLFCWWGMAAAFFRPAAFRLRQGVCQRLGTGCQGGAQSKGKE